MLSPRGISGTLLACLLLAPLASLRAEPLGDLQITPELRQDEPPFFVRADVDRADRYYRAGDPLSVRVIAEQDAYLYVLYEQADGKHFQIFPNSAQPQNRVAAKTEVVIPAADDQFRWRVAAPFGKERIKVLASREPLKHLDNPALREQRFNPVSTGQLHALAQSLQADGEQQPAWSEDVVEITTAPTSAAPIARQGKRFGVFFGVSEYEFNEIIKQAAEGKWEPNLPCPANNAEVLGRMMKIVGQLDEVQIRTNEQATRPALEAAITQWLPSVSRPGDTVFIFVGGHGGQIPDDNGDEADRKDEWLLLHDYADWSVFKALAEQSRQGKLDPKLQPRLEAWAALIRRHVNPNDPNGAAKADALLNRATGVSDDLFGHWLQRLAGRQVVVLLDTCHAAGLASNEKSLAAPAGGFDFLDGEIGRLKDIGQAESALLAACGAQQSSYALRAPASYMEKLRAEGDGEKTLVDERVDVYLAVFTYHLIETLLSQPPPLDLLAAHRQTRDGMRNYFVEYNELMRQRGESPLTPHEAQLFNFQSRPVLLKP